MRNIDIKEVEGIKKQLEMLGDEDVAFIDEDGQSKYAVMNLNYFEKLDSYRQLSEKNGPVFNTQVKIFSGGSPMEDLSYDEYEKIRNQLLEIFDKSFRPKNDKLN